MGFVFSLFRQGEINMPIHKVNGGYKWGNSGKIYPTKEQAEKQQAAIYSSGYKETPKKKSKKK